MQAYVGYWQQMAQLLGATFLHFLWQGAVIAALYALLRPLVSAPASRYRLGVTALLALALAPLFTLWRSATAVGESAVQASGPGVDGVVQAVLAAPAGGMNEALRVLSAPALHGWLPWVGALWLAGVLCLSLNSWRQWHRMHRLLRRDAQAVPEWQSKLLQLCDRFAILPRVQLLQSAQVLTPTLIGWIKPVILLPMSVLSGFTPQQIEMIIAHELGHVRRWDYLVNLFQVVLETVLFYHPAVHWISRDVRNVRETCCDDLVIELGCGSPLAYAHTLANLEGLRIGMPAPALAANGGMLLARVRRIVGLEQSGAVLPSRQHGWMMILLLATGLGVCMHWSILGRHPAAAVRASILLPARLALQSGALLVQSWWPQAAAPRPAPARETRAPSDMATVAAMDDAARRTRSAEGVAVAHVTRPDEARPGSTHAPESLPLTPLAPPATLALARTGATLAVADIAVAPVALSAVLQEPDVAPRQAEHSSAAPLDTVADAALASVAMTAAPSPRALHRVSPAYPAEARAVGDGNGEVTLSFRIDAEGAVNDVAVLDAQGNRAFVDAASTALQQWRFAPAVAGTTARYSQTFAFAGVAAETGGNGCVIATGTHICRRDAAHTASPGREGYHL